MVYSSDFVNNEIRQIANYFTGGFQIMVGANVEV